MIAPLDVDCPKCGVPRGRGCRNCRTGFLSKGHCHIGRVYAARAANEVLHIVVALLEWRVVSG